ncbi:MAG: sigma-70 family RNA polymerase sigma factor [Ruminococcus sp.]|nr:sigma-70 family RNA polymerase sigma factor [Ruminococcus sp.]
MTKETLLAYKNIRRELQSIEKQIMQLKADARSVKGVRYTDSPRGRGEPVSAQQRYIERLEELSALYEDKKAQLMESQIAIERAITSLPPELRILMRYRYIDGMRWEDVNAKMYISEPTSKRMHRKAMQLIGK